MPVEEKTPHRHHNLQLQFSQIPGKQARNQMNIKYHFDALVNKQEYIFYKFLVLFLIGQDEVYVFTRSSIKAKTLFRIFVSVIIQNFKELFYLLSVK